MRPVRSLLIYIVAVFAGGALIAPWVYWLAQSVAQGSRLASIPFHRYLDRSLLIVALLGVWPLMRSLGAKSFLDVGLVNPRGRWRSFGTGIYFSSASLAVLTVVALFAHARQSNDSVAIGESVAKLGVAALTACSVSLLEEILFRGAIFGALRKIWDWRAALLVSSMIYAIVHFLAKSDLPGTVTWTSGFRLLPLKLSGFGDLHVVIPGFFNLTLVGAMLALAYHRTGDLYCSIGLHMGWIFWLKSYNVLTLGAPHYDTWLWGTDKLIDGWMALIVLALAVPILSWLLPDKSQKSSP